MVEKSSIEVSGYEILAQGPIRPIIEANPFSPLPNEINAPYIQTEVNHIILDFSPRI